MLELDININYKHLYDVYLLVKVTYFYKIADNDLKDYILE